MTSHAPDSNGAPAHVGLVSDVHGNLPAFEAVIADAATQGVDELWNLGDLVGYGAQPDECVALAREKCSVVLAGNHDLGVIGKIDIDDFSPPAAAAARWTRENAARETLDYLAKLEPTHVDAAIGLYHASPRDPIWEYVLSTAQADECIDTMGERIAAVGHTHVALRFCRDADQISGEAMLAGTTANLNEGRWLLNPGSVGQPRDGDPRAAWLSLDTTTWQAQWRRVEYSIEDAAAAIERAGLPRSLGDRLHIGQ